MGWVDRKPQGSPCLHLVSTEITSIFLPHLFCCCLSLMWILEFKLRSHSWHVVYSPQLPAVWYSRKEEAPPETDRQTDRPACNNSRCLGRSGPCGQCQSSHTLLGRGLHSLLDSACPECLLKAGGVLDGKPAKAPPERAVGTRAQSRPVRAKPPGLPRKSSPKLPAEQINKCCVNKQRESRLWTTTEGSP